MFVCVFLGEPDKWFEHNAKNPPPEVAGPRCPTEESKKYHDKIHGKEENWYKMEENRCEDTVECVKIAVISFISKNSDIIH